MQLDLKILLNVFTFLQIIVTSENSHVQEAKRHINAEIRSAIGQRHHPHPVVHRLPPHLRSPSPIDRQYHRPRPPIHRISSYRQHHHGYHTERWSGRRWSSGRHLFTSWSAWTVCDKHECVQRRERYCKVKRKCGHTRHLEERRCWSCSPHHAPWESNAHNTGNNQQQQQQQQQQQTINHSNGHTPAIIINAAAAAASTGPTHQPLLATQPPPIPPTPPVPTPPVPTPPPTKFPSTSPPPHPTVSNSPHAVQHLEMPVLQEMPQQAVHSYPPQKQHHHSLHNDNDHRFDGTSSASSEERDFYALNTRPRFKKQRKPLLVNADDYEDLLEEQELEEDDELNSMPSQDYHDDLEAYANEDNDDEEDYITEARRQTGPVRAIRTRGERHGRKHKRKRADNAQRRGRQQNHDKNEYDDSQMKLNRDREHVKQRELQGAAIAVDNDGIEGDTFQYEDFDFDQDLNRFGGGGGGAAFGDTYEDDDYTDYRNGSYAKERATPDGLIPRHRRLYSKWSRWTKCSPKCTTRRYKKCRVREQCGREVLREIAYCYTEGSFCQQWLQAQVQKSPPYELRPMATATRRRDIIGGVGGDTETNSIVNDYILNGKGYRGPEYQPMKLKCGIPMMRNSNNKRKNMYNMLKIIGGKESRKGEWPWQVAIFNRFKEAFCGGTLIAPQWVLTAAHCVRKVLYVRIGDWNLDHEDGTELQLRVYKTFKHPNYDKKTVDSDIALLRLPRPVNATNWIGFSCLPHPYQPLPKNYACTVIGWGKRRNRDAFGTSVLHQAEVPIIPMNNCRTVYHDYTITKNMFCAGHKLGRIDTCEGDSGGPLLCRDTTKPNHPWTIFGITSFGDGCAKRNKFGIYAKVPNYVDWIWSVVNCNGNCKMQQRSY